MIIGTAEFFDRRELYLYLIRHTRGTYNVSAMSSGGLELLTLNKHK